MKVLKHPVVVAAIVTGVFAIIAAIVKPSHPSTPPPVLPEPSPALSPEKRIQFNLVKITVNLDCDSDRNGGDFEGEIRLRLPDNRDVLLTTLDVIDGEDHDTKAGIREGEARTLNKMVEFNLMPGGSFNFYGTKIVETTGNDHEFDDNPVTLNETYTYANVNTGPHQKALDDGDKCKLTFDWNIKVDEV